MSKQSDALGYGILGLLAIGLGYKLLRRRVAKTGIEACGCCGQAGCDNTCTGCIIGGVGEDVKGLLLDAVKQKEHEPITLVEVAMGDIIFKAAQDAVKVRVDGQALRLGCSYNDSINMCRELGGFIVPSQKICDAMYVASNRLVFHSTQNIKNMAKLSEAIVFNRDIDAQIAAKGQGAPNFGAWKLWILNGRLSEPCKDNGFPAAINYGGWGPGFKSRCGNVSCAQSVGAQHDRTHYDNSQLFQPVKRYARRISDGSEVDLLDWMEINDIYDGKKITREMTNAFRSPVS